MYRVYFYKRTGTKDKCIACGGSIFKIHQNKDECIKCKKTMFIDDLDDLTKIYNIVDCKNKNTLKLLYG